MDAFFHRSYTFKAYSSFWLSSTHSSQLLPTLATFRSIQQAELNRSLQHSCGDIPRQWNISNPHQTCSFGEGRRVHEQKDSHSLGIVHNHNDDERSPPRIPLPMICHVQHKLENILLHCHTPLIPPLDMIYLIHTRSLHDGMMTYSRKGFTDELTPSGVGWWSFAWLGYGIRS